MRRPRRPMRLGAAAAAALLGTALAASPQPAPVVPGYALEWPRDHGSHPGFRTEWWYVTGWLTAEGGQSLGFQVTFFRTRPQLHADNPSAFTPHQILIAHAAVSDPARGQLWKDERIARAGFGLAEAREADAHIWIDSWSLERETSRWLTRIDAQDFGIQLSLTPTQPPLLNGESGFSQKGPARSSASYYYSLPHLAVHGTILRSGVRADVVGEAWLDHEWSSQYLDAQAAGWDWIGINLNDGGALMAFRMRDRRGSTRFAGGTLRAAGGAVRVLRPAEIVFTATRRWRSPRTGIEYPLGWQVRAGERDFALAPLMDDQESDTRMSTGAIYWEGAVRAREAGRDVGRGYLELTGYGEALQLR